MYPAGGVIFECYDCGVFFCQKKHSSSQCGYCFQCRESEWEYIGWNHPRVTDRTLRIESVLLAPEDLPGLRREAPRTEQVHDFHYEIRALMDMLENGGLERVNSVVNLAAEWPNWKKYIARHKDAELIVGPGIVSFTAELIPDKNECFRNSLRLTLVLALVLRQSDGGWVVLIPGSHPNSDARPQCFEAPLRQGCIAPVPIFNNRALQRQYRGTFAPAVCGQMPSGSASAT